MGQGPAPFLRANAQLGDPGAPCHRLTARAGRKRAALPRTEAPTHQARMPPRCTIAIVHEQGAEARSEMNTREQGAEVRPGWSSTKCGLPLNAPPSPVHAREAPTQGTPFGIRLAPCAPRIRPTTSGRFRRPNQPEMPRSADVSPGRRSRQRTASAETTQKPRTNGEIGARFLRNRSEVAGVYVSRITTRFSLQKQALPSDKLQASRKVFKQKRLPALHGS